jgi:phage-related protein
MGKQIYKYTYSRIIAVALKTVRWVGAARRELKTFPKAVQRLMGQALYAAQWGEDYPTVKAINGFGGRSVLEIVANHQSDTWRAIYTVRFADTIYVLHAFQKKSRRALPRQERKSN